MVYLPGMIGNSIAQVRRPARTARWVACVLLLALPATAPVAAPREKLALHHVTLDLPGPPAKVMPADLNGDGRTDLVVVVAYTEIEEIGEDTIENLVQISQVIPALFDRREVRAYLAQPDGSYEFVGPPLLLPRSVLHLEPGPDPTALVALTDEGISMLRSDVARGGAVLRFEPVIEGCPVGVWLL